MLMRGREKRRRMRRRRRGLVVRPGGVVLGKPLKEEVRVLRGERERGQRRPRVLVVVVIGDRNRRSDGGDGRIKREIVGRWWGR